MTAVIDKISIGNVKFVYFSGISGYRYPSECQLSTGSVVERPNDFHNAMGMSGLYSAMFISKLKCLLDTKLGYFVSITYYSKIIDKFVLVTNFKFGKIHINYETRTIV